MNKLSSRMPILPQTGEMPDLKICVGGAGRPGAVLSVSHGWPLCLRMSF